MQIRQQAVQHASEWREAHQPCREAAAHGCMVEAEVMSGLQPARPNKWSKETFTSGVTVPKCRCEQSIPASTGT